MNIKKKSLQVFLANSTTPVENLWIKTPFHCFKCHKVIINSLSPEQKPGGGKKSRDHLVESWLLWAQEPGHYENAF